MVVFHTTNIKKLAKDDSYLKSSNILYISLSLGSRFQTMCWTLVMSSQAKSLQVF